MAKILIADAERGKAHLTRILSVSNDLFFADTVEDVLQLARTQTFDLLIIGVLFDYSSMADLVRTARTTSELMSIPIMGFSDEHTPMTIGNRDTLEKVMHVIGASDYVDTRDMSDDEILSRIQACLDEGRPVAKRPLPSEPTPKIKRTKQEVTRWSNRIKNAALLQPVRILLVGDEKQTTALVEKIETVHSGIFDITKCEAVQSALIENTHEPFKALMVTAETVDECKSDFQNFHNLTPELPMIVAGTPRNVNDFSKVLPSIDSNLDGLEIALSVLSAIDDKAPEPNAALAKLSITCLRQSAESIKSGASLKNILTDFCSKVEEYARLQLSSDVAVSILLLNEQGDFLVSGAAPSLPEDYNRAIAKVAVGPDSGSCGTAAHTRDSVFVTDIASDSRWINFREAALKHNLASCWSVPIFSESQNLVGTFAIYSATARTPDASELDLIGALSSIAAAILVQAEKSNHKQLLRH